MMSKRLFDLVVSGVVLTVLSIPFALVAMIVALSSSGPVIYRQQRIGRWGRPFWLYKFRTMRVDSTGSQVTVTGDRRVYPVGRWLRRWKIDELPQFWNIVRGEMSVVGPRPEVARFVRHYSAEARRLLDQKPGLASLSQLVYPHEPELLEAASDPEATYVSQLLPRKLAIDLQYEATRTFWSDLRLLAEVGLLVAGKSYRIDRSLIVASRDTAAAARSQR